MDDQERMRERVELFCDADARSRINAADVATYCPTLGEILDTMG